MNRREFMKFCGVGIMAASFPKLGKQSFSFYDKGPDPYWRFFYGCQ